MVTAAESSLVVDSRASTDQVRSALASSSLAVSRVSVTGDSVTATNGSQLIYRIFGGRIAFGRRNIPADISIAPVGGEQGRARVTVRPNNRMFAFLAPAHYDASRELAESVARVVRSAG